MTNNRNRARRVNARLAEDDARKLGYLSKQEGRSVSEIIRAAIQRYFSEARAAEAAATGLLDRSGFIGCGEAAPDLSTTYKHHLTEFLRSKHGDR